MEGFSKQHLGLFLGPALFVVVMLIPPPASMIDAARAAGAAGWAPQLPLGMLAWILTWRVTECMPLGLAALAVPLVFSLSGVVPWRTTLTAFADPIIWIIMAGVLLELRDDVEDVDSRAEHSTEADRGVEGGP